MNKIHNSDLDEVVHHFIQDAGAFTQSLGFGRAIGQIYAYLYFSPEARNLANMQQRLGISKGSASTNVRQLEQWGAVRKVWVKGDRKDYYAASDWFGKILKNALVDTMNKKVSSYGATLDDAMSRVSKSGAGRDDVDFVKSRVGRILEFHGKAESFVKSPLWRTFFSADDDVTSG